MKLQLILELLILFTLISFIASKVVEKKSDKNITTIVRQEIIDSNDEVTVTQDLVESGEVSTESIDTETNPINENDPNPINKYCSCTESVCECCRNFIVPIVPVRGPGCATIRYIENNKVSVTIKYGTFVLASRTISGQKSTPICLPLPGGYSRFCGRIYGISRSGENFKACLGLELRAEDELEAALRVSCFQFGPRGLSVADSEPLPPIEKDENDDDDDDDDIFGLGEALGGDGDADDDDDDDAADDDDDDDDDDDGDDNADDDDDGDATGILGDDTDDADEDSADDTGFSFFGSSFLNGIFGSGTKKKKVAEVTYGAKKKNQKDQDIENNEVLPKKTVKLNSKIHKKPENIKPIDVSEEEEDDNTENNSNNDNEYDNDDDDDESNAEPTQIENEVNSGN